ncbi:IS91 family transposase [Desulfosporosinus lacus]|uniref:Transposase zinc-binding domain-containing protein n=1 Tax=Desulfosporosinus lacus DSM 15449 TaxID=1121420 RepID=A0A1M5ZZB0_9FIRM|nr:IS91 family transposase [Desulfosporosinus lacus]SHI29243.1 Transposase zinc-binding domain-containing protein [Desulfosporosinus lacus DSM 15449]
MPELQDIFKHIQLKRLSPTQAKAFHMIRLCRTSTLGSHAQVCTECGVKEVSFNSCRNRHCPKCQHSVQQEWVEAQMSKLLPVGYFHVVFTIPQELNTLVLQNQRLLYSLLIKSAGHTLMELSKDPKFLGATIGATSVLHTCGQNLSFHPHVHCIVPGGGLSNDGLRFVRSRKKFFIPVKVISKKFKGKFLNLLKQAYNQGELAFFNEATKLALRSNFLSLVDNLYGMNWVVFCKKPFKSPVHVVRYLGRYTHKVAISNSRIQALDGQSVSFAWRDYKDGNKSKVMTLDAAEFCRRFLLHVLPNRFIKIRHYGLLSSRNIKTKLFRCFRLTGNNLPPPSTIAPKNTKTCPSCGSPCLIQFLPICSKASP